jgi:hypothetical protein
MELKNYNYFDEGEANINLDEFEDFNDFISRRRQPKDLGFFPTNVAQNPAMVDYGITSLPEFDMANLPMYEKDDEQDQEYINQVNQSNNKFGGIMDLLMGIAIPGYGLFKNIAQGGLEGLKGFNQRLQQSDFGQSKTLMEYLGKRQARKETERLAPIQKQLQEASERGGGYQPTTRSQNVARTSSRVSDGKTRAYGL